ncbi:N-acetyl-gamma-glutamyl-phosphate reductase [Dermatobacter hominis]|uniref:N-acetyl-gamma-glutamyl-phosphate reductase n=1 Tax=Dermatobacter hominis TaxID=2884263 RepID=UPI001D11D16C|nr:N-acetyl-gamma-glutamyl-phosphate reductase [Dermatobacter hominis]UDY36224.1 N-acetyl-gamma-glutamyl-phosphate reductase [Dermatobacter hominis]
MATRARIGIIGASGFTGAELLRICASHPGLDVAFATGDTQAGTPAAALYPGLALAYPDLVFESWDPALLDGVDGVFLGLPHGASQAIVPDLLGKIGAVVDLGADFRLSDGAEYERWYHEPHTCPELLDRFVYGIPELHRDALRGAEAVAAPGCYPTAATLALHPLVTADLVQTDGIIVDAVSGVSGAGRPPKPHTTFCAVDSDVQAYGLLDHRHTSEMDMNLGATVLFTPHLVPMNRGILATCYARPAVDGLSTDAVLDVLHERYADEPFVVASERSPSTKATLGTNAAHVTARYDERTGTVLAIAAIDNLGKGASGQAVQCMNLALGLPEEQGLAVVGTAP